MNQQLIGILQIIVGIIVIILVLIQQRGEGIGIIGGMSSQFYGTRRGMEKTIYWLTFILGAFFIFLSLLFFLI